MTLALTILPWIPWMLLADAVLVALYYFAATERKQNAGDAWMKRAIDAEAESGYWMAACRKSYGTTYSLSNAQVQKLYDGLKRGFPDERPDDFHVGTPANPLITREGLALYSSLSDLMTGGNR